MTVVTAPAPATPAPRAAVRVDRALAPGPPETRRLADESPDWGLVDPDQVVEAWVEAQTRAEADPLRHADAAQALTVAVHRATGVDLARARSITGLELAECQEHLPAVVAAFRRAGLGNAEP